MTYFGYMLKERKEKTMPRKLGETPGETGRNPRGEGEELPGKRGERVGETGTRRPPCIITPPAVRTNGGRRSF